MKSECNSLHKIGRQTSNLGTIGRSLNVTNSEYLNYGRAKRSLFNRISAITPSNLSPDYSECQIQILLCKLTSPDFLTFSIMLTAKMRSGMTLLLFNLSLRLLVSIST